MRQYSISPGNFAGGLTTIEEKSLGALAKSGSRPIQGVLKVAQSPPWPGLWLLDTVPDPHFMQHGYTNPNDTEGIMDLISVGSQILLFVTGRGSVIGSPVSPLMKITGNSETYRNLSDDIDFDAGRLLTGDRTLDQLGDELLEMTIETARGARPNPSDSATASTSSCTSTRTRRRSTSAAGLRCSIADCVAILRGRQFPACDHPADRFRHGFNCICLLPRRQATRQNALSTPRSPHRQVAECLHFVGHCNFRSKLIAQTE